MERRVFAGITAVILLLSSILLYFSEDDEKDIDDIIVGNGLVPVWERVNQPQQKIVDFNPGILRQA